MSKQLSLFAKLKATSSSALTKTTKRAQGDHAEALALSYLRQQGLTLIARNFSTRAGEVDLIMQAKTDSDTLIFIEVRYRKNQDYGGAAASVTYHKQQRIIKAALAYHQQFAPQAAMRFDVIAIEGDNDANTANAQPNTANIDWIQNAFSGF